MAEASSRNLFNSVQEIKMYPYPILFGMTLYEIFIIVGVIGVMIVFRFFGDRYKFSARLQNLVLFNTLAAITGGYFSAVLFQAFYDFMATGEFVLNQNTGATFYGGLFGGVATFIGVYFAVGAFMFKDREHLRAFPHLFNIAGVAIPLAHGFGRLGCLSVGCCHGGKTDAWYGIYSPELGYKFVPIQLFEALVLFAIAVSLFFLLLKSKRFPHTMSIYLMTYGIWRFFAEFFRADNRGQTIVEGLTPSQLTAIVLFFAAILLYVLLEYLYARKNKTNPF